MVSTLFRDPQARSSALAALGTLQLRAFGALNRVETLDSVSNYYLVSRVPLITKQMAREIMDEAAKKSSEPLKSCLRHELRKHGCHHVLYSE